VTVSSFNLPHYAPNSKPQRYIRFDRTLYNQAELATSALTLCAEPAGDLSPQTLALKFERRAVLNLKGERGILNHPFKILSIQLLCDSLMSSKSLLFDLAIVHTLDVQPGLTDDERGEIQAIVSRYADGRLSYDQASALFEEKFHTTTPIDKIRVILEVQDEPLPPQPDEESEDGLRRKTQQWTAAEDARLLAGIRRFGFENWSSVARFVGNGRSRSQCSQRWQRGLDPRISRTPWTTQDDTLLLSLVSKYGEKSWIRVCTEIGNRSDVQCRYRYMQLQNIRPRRAPPSPARVERPRKAEMPIPIVPHVTPSPPKEPEYPASFELFAIERVCLELGAQSASEIFWMLHP
jgi:hypothetical protein